MGEVKEKKGFFRRLKEGLTKTRSSIISGFDSAFTAYSEIDDDFYEEIEEILIMGDVGIQATTNIINDLREKVEDKRIRDPRKCRELLMESIRDEMKVDNADYEFENRKSVVLVVGVNGVGKTTSIGKLAGILKDEGKSVVLAAADTFRAAASEQLTEWARRAQVPIISGKEGADPASIVYDAIASAKSRDADILIIDTAGRLHNKKNLMNELEKMNKVISREWPEAARETLLILDATTGKNAISQAQEFGNVADITGIVITKLDGTAKGGIAIAIRNELGLPVRYIGLGEQLDDMQPFDAKEFVEALF